MPQLILPLIPQGASAINQRVSVFRDEDSWTYFIGAYPVYWHRNGDQKTFRFVSSQLIQSNPGRGGRWKYNGLSGFPKAA